MSLEKESGKDIGVISAVRLEIEDPQIASRLMQGTEEMFKQLDHLPGYRGSLATGKHPFYYVITSWHSEDALRKFYQSPDHFDTMKGNLRFVKKVISTHWDSNQIPELDEISEKLDQEQRKRNSQTQPT